MSHPSANDTQLLAALERLQNAITMANGGKCEVGTAEAIMSAAAHLAEEHIAEEGDIVAYAAAALVVKIAQRSANAGRNVSPYAPVILTAIDSIVERTVELGAVADAAEALGGVVRMTAGGSA